MTRPALETKQHRLACQTLVLGVVLSLGAGCSPALKHRKVSDEGSDPAAKLGQNKIRFSNPEMAALYQAAKASPKSFEPVHAYAKAVADVSRASLIEENCDDCGEGAVRYKRRSELEPHYWPIIEDALSMLEVLGNVPNLPAEQMDQVVATKGRLLWLVGRSMEEQTLIDEYARAHPAAVAVIRRRLELLRESGDTDELESQCARSRARTESAPDAARVDLLTACVAFHPNNRHGRSDLLDFAKYLPNLSKAEDTLYRANLVQRCEQKVGDEKTRCAQACSCEDKDSGKQPTARCKRTCGSCRSETAQKQHVCKKIGEVASPPTPRARKTPSRSHRRKSAPARRHKDVEPPSGGPKLVL
jgi:hypothetical protein